MRASGNLQCPSPVALVRALLARHQRARGILVGVALLATVQRLAWLLPMLLFTASPAEAVPTQLGGRFTHIQNFVQTGASTHVLEDMGYTFIAFQEGMDLNAVTLTPPGKPAVGLPQIVFNPPASSDQFHLDAEFSTLADLNAAFPGGTYQFDLTYSDATTSTYLLATRDPLAFPTSIPTITNYLPGATVASLTPTFQFNLFTKESWMQFQTISFVLIDAADNNLYNAAFVYDPGAPITSFTVPEGVLAAGGFYEISIFFNGQPDSVFTGDQTSTSGIGNLSFFEFRTVPEPGTVLLLASVLLALGGAGWLRMRRDEDMAGQRRDDRPIQEMT